MRKIPGIVLLLMLSFFALAESTDDRLEIFCLDVGQADATVICCGGQAMMIDGGRSEDSGFIYTFLKEDLGLDRIDVMVASHPAEDHLGGLSAALHACKVRTLFSPVEEYENEALNDLMRNASWQELRPILPRGEADITLGGAEVRLFCLPEEAEGPNDMCIVTKITYGGRSFLFMADAEDDLEMRLLDTFGIGTWKADVLRVGHHGSETSTSWPFLAAVQPETAVISVGAGNDYGHPSAAVLNSLEQIGAAVFRTDLDGTVVITCDGETITVEHGAAQMFAAPHADPEEGSGEPELPYIGNKNSMKFHHAWCDSVKDMKEKNKVFFRDREEAESEGYVPCKRCEP